MQRGFRRAKIKLLAKKSIETGEDCDSIPESMRAYLAMQELQNGKPSAREFYGPLSLGPGPVNTFGGGILLNADSSSPGKVGTSYSPFAIFGCLLMVH